jgi:hypothetical protein
MAIGWEPDWSQALTETHLVYHEKWTIPPCGYLLAVTITDEPGQLRINSGDLHWKAQFEITDADNAALYGQINWDYPMVGCGIAFRDPLPNMDARGSYVLARKSPTGECPPVRLTLTYLMVERTIR